MNLHTIRTHRPNPHETHYYDYILDAAFFSADEYGDSARTYGNLVEVWVEDNKAYGTWVDENEWRWKIHTYEYDNDYDIERILANGDPDFLVNGWYVDTGHIP